MPDASATIPHRRRRRRLAATAIVAGALVLLTCVASEWRGVVWWSNVRGLGVGPYQRFAILSRGELRIGTRGTGGFFTRPIPAAGIRIEPPFRTLLNPPERVWMAWWYTRPQVGVFILPLTPIAGLAIAIGLGGLMIRVHGPSECAACGYDLGGLPAGPCPECGANRTPAGGTPRSPGPA